MCIDGDRCLVHPVDVLLGKGRSLRDMLPSLYQRPLCFGVLVIVVVGVEVVGVEEEALRAALSGNGGAVSDPSPSTCASGCGRLSNESRMFDGLMRYVA